MKRKVLAMLVPALLVAGAANAAEIYNKDGNKLDLYGKVAGLHYFSDDASSDGDMSYARIGFKGETQIADQFTGYGQWEFNIVFITILQPNKPPKHSVSVFFFKKKKSQHQPQTHSY
ncbi:porin, partial [Escherichia coli]|uniref:porin n=1 Tax=Escherichia coli TaxID=562 RepID=UPI000B677B4F